jgi:hypothetical protein
MGRVTIAAMLVGFALAAAVGCGGGGSSDQDEINRVLTTSFTTADPAQCDELTQKGLQQLAPSVATAPNPAKACRDALDPNSNADSIQVTGLSVNGDRATATVTPHAGSFGGAVVTVALANQDGWKIDGFDDFKIVDRDAYLASLDEATKRSFGSDALTGRNARCIADYIRRRVTNEQLEQSITSAQKGYVFDAVRLCLGGGVDFIAITQLIENQLLHAGIDPAHAACLAGLSIAGQKSATLEEFATSERIKQSVEKVLRKGAFLCKPAR